MKNENCNLERDSEVVKGWMNITVIWRSTQNLEFIYSKKLYVIYLMNSLGMFEYLIKIQKLFAIERAFNVSKKNVDNNRKKYLKEDYF